MPKKRKYKNSRNKQRVLFSKDRKPGGNPRWCTCQKNADDYGGLGKRTHSDACPREEWLLGKRNDPVVGDQVEGEEGSRKGKTAEYKKKKKKGSGNKAAHWEVVDL